MDNLEEDLKGFQKKEKKKALYASRSQTHFSQVS